MITLYGISNCDTVRKTRNWLESENLPFTFHDFRKHGLDKALAEILLEEFGPEVLINRRGTTWRQLSDEQKSAAGDAISAASLIQSHPALIKRPVFRSNSKWLLGYNETTLNALKETGSKT